MELLADLEVKGVLNKMYSKIKHFDKSEYDNMASSRTGAKDLLMWLSRRGKDEYDVFLEALKHSQPHLHEMLCKPNPEFDKFFRKA